MDVIDYTYDVMSANIADSTITVLYKSTDNLHSDVTVTFPITDPVNIESVSAQIQANAPTPMWLVQNTNQSILDESEYPALMALVGLSREISTHATSVGSFDRIVMTENLVEIDAGSV